MSNWIILKTNISRPESISLLAAHFNKHPEIQEWSIDEEDMDHVLRVFSHSLNQDTLITIINHLGFVAEDLNK